MSVRIKTATKVYLIGKPSLVPEGLQAFLRDEDLKWPTPMEGVSDPAIITEVMGRNCYMSYGDKAGSKTNQVYINNLLGRVHGTEFKPGPAHGSVVEHVNWNFIVAGADRGFTHEQVRHRVGTGYSQLSTRYCDYERDKTPGTWAPAFRIPPMGMLSERTQEIFRRGYNLERVLYVEALESIMQDLEESGLKAKLESEGKSEREVRVALRKAARGAARSLLPIGSEAILGFTANARAIWNMMYLRASQYAEGIIRDVFCQVATIMETESGMPELFYGLEFEKMWDGSVYVKLPRDKL